ncbi:MAG: amylo-alpha-1,6-glucosidase, partial [Candidatus Promineifilaceae bacterium]
GLLIAALHPPLGRTLLVTKLDEEISYKGNIFPLFVNRWADGTLDSDGFKRLYRFRKNGTIPVWTFALDDALLEKRIWMQQGTNTTYVRYDFIRGSGELHLSKKVMLNDRDYHGVTGSGDVSFRIASVSDGVKVETSHSRIPYYIFSQDMVIDVRDQWYQNYSLSVERYRGLPDVEAHYFGARATAILRPGESATVVFSTESHPELDGYVALKDRDAHEQGLLNRTRLYFGDSLSSALPKQNRALESLAAQLTLAADQFIVKRSTAGDPDGLTVIAGYPWFGDWGRDTMIALPGLTLATGRADDAAKILCTFASYVDKGMLPNRFPDEGEEPEYNTADATLWYFEALRAYHDFTGDLDLVRELYPVLREIIEWHVRGTRYNIGLDPVDGLLYAGETGVQLTWMDAKVGDWVVTPRIGKPVEINALWFNALNIMAAFAGPLGESAGEFFDLAQGANRGFQRYWNHSVGYCYDVLDGPEGHDPALRPNQILAVSLPYSPLDEYQRKEVVDCCAKQLLTSYGLRSLSADHPEYAGTYGGDVTTRDGAYHQGIVWGWLIGPFVTAHLRVYGDLDAATAYLQPFLIHIQEHGIGSISEIFDGDAPFNPRGCPAQAWSVAELLRGLQTMSGSRAD